MHDVMPIAPRIAIGPPITSSTRRRWEDVERRIRDLDAALLRTTLLSDCYAIASRFGARSGIPLAESPADLESRYVATVQGFAELRSLVRRVEDRELGARWTGSDFDLIEHPTGFLGVFIPVAIGVGVVAFSGLIARLFYLEQETIDISDRYNSLVEHTDAAFCADPNSQTCGEWQIEKQVSGFEKNKTFADSLKSSIGKIGGGIGKGIALALPVIALAIFWGKR